MGRHDDAIRIACAVIGGAIVLAVIFNFALAVGRFFAGDWGV